MDRYLLHGFLSSKYYHQNVTPPSALHEVLVCDGISIPRACHCSPGRKPPAVLVKEEKVLSPRRALVTQDPASILQCSGWLYVGAGRQCCQHLMIWGGWQLSININTSERDATARCTSESGGCQPWAEGKQLWYLKCQEECEGYFPLSLVELGSLPHLHSHHPVSPQKSLHGAGSRPALSSASEVLKGWQVGDSCWFTASLLFGWAAR